MGPQSDAIAPEMLAAAALASSVIHLQPKNRVAKARRRIALELF